MFASSLRIVVIIFALIGAVMLFAFAFTTAAVIVLVLLLIGFIFGRGRRTKWTVIERGPVVIDHDPNDLPGSDKPGS
jgi:chromate transport protein ChrA